MKTQIHLLLMACLAWPVAVFATAARIHLDADFSDWQAVTTNYTDTEADGGAVDFRLVKVANDENYLFMMFETGGQQNLQSNNQISLYIDTDNNPDTGSSINGLGADLIWNFGSRNGRFWYNDAQYTIGHRQLGLVTAPTVSGPMFELALPRQATIASNPVFSSSTIAFMFKDYQSGDSAPNTGQRWEYTFDQQSLPPLESIPIQKHNEADFRIISWNILWDSFFEPGLYSQYDRLLDALNPDIIGFEEVGWENSAATTRQRISQMLPGRTWYADKRDDLVLTSIYPILYVEEIVNAAAFVLNTGNLGSGQLMVVLCHLSFSDADADRQDEADRIMRFIYRMQNGTGSWQLAANSPIIIMGDMNFVGLPNQAVTLITGNIANPVYGQSFNPDWDNTALSDLTPRHNQRPLTYTWNDGTSSYWPGRLDYLIYTNSVLEPKRSFVLDSSLLDSDFLQQYGLDANDNQQASDHLPVCADFSVAPITATSNNNTPAPPALQCTAWPNPFAGNVNLNVRANTAGKLKVSVYNLRGQLVKNIYQGQSSSSKSLSWDGRNNQGQLCPSGVYLVRMTQGATSTNKRILLLK